MGERQGAAAAAGSGDHKRERCFKEKEPSVAFMSTPRDSKTLGDMKISSGPGSR